MPYLIIFCLFLCSCASKPPTQHVGITPGDDVQAGWSANKNNASFNLGEQNWKFDESPVGKLWNSIFGGNE